MSRLPEMDGRMARSSVWVEGVLALFVAAAGLPVVGCSTDESRADAAEGAHDAGAVLDGSWTRDGAASLDASSSREGDASSSRDGDASSSRDGDAVVPAGQDGGGPGDGSDSGAATDSGAGSEAGDGGSGSDADVGSGEPNPNATVIAVGDSVVTGDIIRFGINLGGDNYWDSVLNKNRIKLGGFEGVLYRHIARGPGGDEQSMFDWNDYTFTHSGGDEELSNRTWLDVVTGANAWVLAGDRAWRADVIDRVEHAVYPGRPDEGERLRFVFAEAGPAVGAAGGGQLDEVGLLIEKVEDTVGYVGQHGGPLWTFASSGAQISTENLDLPPGTKGKSVAVLTAPGDETAKLMYPLVPSDIAEPNGTWRVRFWAKGDGALSVGHGPWGDPRDPEPISLTSDWQYFDDIAVTVADYEDENLNLHLSVTGGTVKLDDVSAFREGEANPTSFRDDVVALLKQLRPGVLRHLHMGGSSVDNMLRPDHERMAFSFRREVPPDPTVPWPPHPNTNGGADAHPYGLHEFLQLAEEVGAQPWYCVTGTMFPDEMADLMEYLAGPETSTYGQVRADRGHPQPWTEVFDAIHIEMGNEAWNWAPAYAYGGWNGPEYWSTLFARGRDALASYPGAGERVKFHIGAQNYNTWLGASLVERHGAQADGYAIAPYVIHEMDATAAAWDDEQLFSWAFGWVWHLNTGGPMQENADMIAESNSPHLEMSIYEVNHHITGGSAPVEPRNRIVTSIGGALNIINHMLLMLERYEVRVQNFFSLFQRFHNDVGLWGSVLSAKAGEERYRPTFQTLVLANKVLAGDLVQVDKTGPDPVWHAAFDYYDEFVETDVPFLHAYGTRNGAERGLILLNLHRTDALPVRVGLPAAAQAGTATRWTLSSDDISSNNELDHAPEVVIVESVVEEFVDGWETDLPAHSMTVLSWQE